MISFGCIFVCLFAVVCRVLHAVGAFKLVYVVCCRVVNKPESPPPQEVEMKRLYPEI